MFPRLFVSPLPHICADALSCIPAFLRRSWFGSPPVCCHTPIRQYVSTYVRQCISTYICQYVSGAVCLSVRADLPFQMSVSVHVHLFALLLHRFCPQRNIQIRRSVSFPPCVAAFGFVPVACGVLQPLPGAFLPRIFAPKRQGNAPDAHTAPRLRPSFGQLAGIGRPIPLGLVTGRSIPNPSGTDSCVHEDTARCPLSNSKGFGLLPKRPCPSRGGLPLRSREACFHLRCGCRSYAYAVTPLNPL